MDKIFRDFEAYALITGAASGMGRIYARRLAGMGYSLVLVDINSSGLEETASLVSSDAKVLTIVQDLSSSDAADRIHEITEAAGCEVEVLVNNAGVMFCQGMAETSERMLKLMMAVHMTTPLMLCRKYVGPMKERGRGYILNISSLGHIKKIFYYGFRTMNFKNIFTYYI